MLLTGDFISAQQAEIDGLINRAVPIEQLDATIKQLTDSIVAKSEVAIRMGKELFYSQLDVGVEQAYALASETMACNMMANDAQEGFQAFLEKRQPVWTHS